MIDKEVYDLTQTGQEVQNILDKGEDLPTNAQLIEAFALKADKSDTYSKEQLDNLITTPDVNYVSVVATDATTAVTDILPTTGEENTIYRVGNWDGTQYNPTMYALFAWNGTAYVCLAVRSFVGEVYDISVNHPDGQGNPTPYADLAAALGTSGANIPADIRRGGMRIQFIQGTVHSSDNKYVQYRLMSQTFSTTVGNWQGVDDEPVDESQNLVKSGGIYNSRWDWVFPIAMLFHTTPSASLGENGDYALCVIHATNNRVYKKINGSWVHQSTIKKNIYYVINDAIYYKQEVGDTYPFVKLIDITVNRINLLDDVLGMTKGTYVTTFEKDKDVSIPTCKNKVYKLIVTHGKNGFLKKSSLGILANEGAAISLLVKCSNIDTVMITNTTSYTSNGYRTVRPLGNGWYQVEAIIPGAASDAIIYFNAQASQSDEVFYISDVQICKYPLSLRPNLITDDVKSVENSSYDIKKVKDVTDSFYSSSFNTTLNILGESKVFKHTDNDTHSVDLAEGEIASYGAKDSVPFTAGFFIYATAPTNIYWAIYDRTSSAYIKEVTLIAENGWNFIKDSTILTSTQISHKIRIRTKCDGSYLYKLILFSGIDTPTVYWDKTLAEIEAEIHSITDGVVKNCWYNKKLSVYGDSITAICNGDYSKPFDTDNTKWASKVSSFLKMASLYGRGVGGSAFSWIPDGGSLVWCTADGNYVDRYSGNDYSYDDYLNPETHDAVLTAIEAEGYDSSIHTLCRGSLSSWLRITTMFPASIKDRIDVILVQAHNDTSRSLTLPVALSWVESSNVDKEWASSTYYSTYGGDYNIDGSLRGAIASTIMKLQAWMPQALIVLMTPISGRGTQGKLNVELTDSGMQAVAEGIRDVHKLMSIPMIDMYANDCINGLNRTTYISDTIHPYTVAGSKMLARVICGEMNRILPKDIFDV